MNQDIQNLTDLQLITVLLGSENLSKELLKEYRNDLTDMAKNILQANIKGIGHAKLSAISAAFELGRRKAKQDEINRLNAQIVNSSRAVFAQFNSDLSSIDHEELWALYMSKNGKILKRIRISEGGTDFAGADIKKIVKPAIDNMASYVALCHNHPHSTTRPSQPDRDLTKKTKEALSYFDIKLLDHVIISDGSYFSFADNAEL